MTQYEMLIEFKKILSLPDEEQVKAFFKLVMELSEFLKLVQKKD